MKLRKLTAILLAAALLAALLSGCVPSAEQVQKDFQNFLDELFIEEVSSNTITLHYTLRYPETYELGEMEPKMYDLSMDDSGESYASLKTTLARLKRFPESKLTKEQKYIRKMLIKYVELNLSAQGLDYYGTYLDSIGGLPANMPINLAEYSFYTEKDVTDYLALLDQFPTIFDQALSYEQKRVELELGLSDASLDEAIEQCNNFLTEKKNNYLILTFDKRVDALGLSAEKTNQYKALNKTAFEEKIVPAYEKMAIELGKMKGKGKNDKGLAYFEKGKEYYQFLVSLYTGSDYTADALVQKIENSLNSYAGELISTIQTNPAAYDYLYSGSAYGYDVSGLEDMPREERQQIWQEICIEMLEDLKIKMLDFLPALPENNYTVNFVEEALEDSLSPAFFMVPPIDDYLNNVIYVNLGSVDISSLHSTLAHEGYPGHLYQMAYFTNTEHHPIRNLITFDGYTEGWAVYMENKSYEMFTFDRYDAAVDKIARLMNLWWLALYSRVDIGVNYQGWGLMEVRNCLTKNYYDGSLADVLMNMVVSSPATPLKYFVGCLEIGEMLQDAQHRLGDKFDIVEFHEQLLDIGPMQFSLIRDYLNEYIAEKLSGGN